VSVAQRKSRSSTAGAKARIKSHAAVDEKRGTGYIVGRVGGKPHGRLRDVIRFADAFVRHERHEVCVGRSRAPDGCIDRRADSAGRDAVDTNAGWGEFLRDAFIRSITPPLDAA